MISSAAVAGVGVLDRIEYQINTSFLRFIRFLIFPIGVSCMIVAGYFLIQGFLQISGNESASTMWIVLGILFQIGESACFVSAAAFTNHSMLWRYSALGFGILLFLMSIGVMTLAQKTAMFAGENSASAIDQQREQINAQISSFDELIASYRLNAEKQSKSIYAESRKLGQESLNKAMELEERKMALSSKLFMLSSKRKQTSMDFFTRIEEMFGYDAQKTEFAFYVARSLFVEGLGIFLMALGAHQYSRHSHVVVELDKAQAKNTIVKKRSKTRKFINKSFQEELKQESDHHLGQNNSRVVSQGSVVSFPASKAELSTNNSNDEIEDFASKILSLYRQNKIDRFGRESIRKALNEHYDIQIGSARAQEVAARVKKLLK